MKKSLHNDTSWFMMILECSNGAGKNEFLSQFTYLHPHFYVKYKRWEYNQ